MKKILIQILFLSGLSTSVFAQKTIDKNNVCESIYTYGSYAVDTFKDTLTLELKITKAYDTKKKYNKEVVFTEKFKNETSIIQIAPAIAIQVLVLRVEIAGKKYYLSAILHYTKKGDCWELISDSPSWGRMSLTSYTTGNSYNGVGFEGELWVK